MSSKNPAPNPAPKRPEAVFQVEVRLKPEYPDAAGKEALALLHEQGLHTARELRTSRLYEIRGAFAGGQIQQAAKELLCDGVTEEFRIDPAASMNGMSHWRVEVWLKPTVSDPVGETVAAALGELGGPAPSSVRCATVYRISGKCGRNHLEKAALRCLANPVVHRIVVTEAHP